ncbi:MAG: hypothetical protein CMN76_11050 [Spirochaetaceae bacterium]|nr:hypothetical protein [Spirochaetaceae bacterium]
MLFLLLATPAVLRAQPTRDSLQRRREYLDLHQIMGMTTLGLWLATNLAGEEANESLYSSADENARMLLLANPQYANDPVYFLAIQEPGPRSFAAEYFLSRDPANNLGLYLALKSQEEWRSRKSGNLHRSLAYATFASYAITAGLAYFAPERIQSTEPGIDSIFFHKAMIPFHLAAMLMLPRLGEQIEHRGPAAAEEMEHVGWAGFGALSIAFFTITF